MNRVAKATIFALISPYLCYALFLKERKIAGKKFLLGMGIWAISMYGSMMVFAYIANDEESATVEDAETLGQVMAEPVMQEIIAKSIVVAYLVQQAWYVKLAFEIRRIVRWQEQQRKKKSEEVA